MNKKGSNFLYLFLILSFFTQCRDTTTINPFGTPAAELNGTIAPGIANSEKISSDAPVVENVTTAVVNGVEKTEQKPLTESLHIITESLFELSMLQEKGQTVTVVFEAASVPHKKSRIIFEPTFFGNEGRVSLPPSSRFVFSGDGIIEVRNGVIVDLSSAQFVLEKGATLQAAPDATVMFVNHKPVKKLFIESEETTGDVNQADTADPKADVSHKCAQKIENNATVQKRAVAILNQTAALADPGQLILRKGGRILLDNPSHLVFGASPADSIMLKAEFGGQFIIDNKDALVSFQWGTFDISFNNFSMLRIMNGTVELNTCKGLASPGVIRTWHFQTGAMLEVKNNSHGLGILSFAANNSEQQHEEIDFDNQTSFTRGSGNLQFKAFNDGGDVAVDSTVKLQLHLFEQKGSMLDLFMSLARIDAPGTKVAARGVKLVQQGNIGDSVPGQLAAFGPSGDGSILPLLPGDHKMFYDSNEPGGSLNVIRGYDAHNRLFVIDDSRRYS